MRTVRFGLLLSCVALGVTAPSALADGTTLYVGNPQSCPKAQYPTISSAVAVAPPYATIRVCPGLYPEHVTLDKPVTLLGAQNGNSATESHATATPDPQRDSIVVNAGQGAFDVIADNVTVSGFTVQGTSPAAGYPDAGIYVHSGSGRLISRDVLTGNGLGLYFDGSQDQLSVTQDGFSGNTRGAANINFIPSGGLFAAGGGPVTNTSISANYFTGNDQFAINVGDPSQGLSIDHNRAQTESTILVLGNAASPEVAFNRGSQIGGSAILLFGNTQSARVEHNVISGTGPGDPNGGSGIRSFQGFGATTSNDGALIAHNDVSNFTFDGFGLGALTNSTVDDNAATGNGRDGVRVRSGSTGNEVAHNRAIGNGRDGIRLDEMASGNTIQRNRASGSGQFDCYDDTTGAGTGGSANIWRADRGQTENRPGLCTAGHENGNGGNRGHGTD